MTLNLTGAVNYDIETFPNAFTLKMEFLNDDRAGFWEISHFRDDRRELMQWFNWLVQTQTPMIGFNNVHFDYPVIHYIFHNPQATVEMIYDFAMGIINFGKDYRNKGKFNPFTVWASDRFAPQIDLYKINHFDNNAKRTSLKALEINMRMDNVVDMPIPVGTVLTQPQIDFELKPYNVHDVVATKKFALYNMTAMEFRTTLVEQFGVDVMNWPDTKIGGRMVEYKLGKEICYDWSSGRKQVRQSPRTRVALADIIFPYIQFAHPEFNRVHEYLKNQVLLAEELKDMKEGDHVPGVKTKGVFKGLNAQVGGINFTFGTGGIHASVKGQVIIATDDYKIVDIDVAQQYPQIAIQNNLAPEHLGERFTEVYSDLPIERKMWQEKKGKKCVEANTLKLGSNGVYGNSNNKYSCFYDPKYMLTTTVNGQLSLCMLAEWLATVPTLSLIQANTDGITYFIHKDHEETANAYCRHWEKMTKLVLENAYYSRMWVRDVNNYIAEDMEGNLKLKGAYWSPDPLDYAGSISAAQPPAWHKDLGNCVSIRAAVAAMVHGVDPKIFIRLTTNPYDFMCRIKVTKAANLYLGDETIQKTSRYYISTNGRPMKKIAPPKYPHGLPKRAGGVTEAAWVAAMQQSGNQWVEGICTKNKSVYKDAVTNIQAGHNVALCNKVKDFNFNELNYNWYVNEAKKLIIC